MNFNLKQNNISYLDQMLPRLNHVIKQEDINVSESGMELLLKMAEGDMRRSLNILQASHMAYNKVDDEIVYKVSYYDTFFKIF